ncbi:MAG: GspL/Epsl periplasmic domain-containing protein [Nitrospirota bacterium]
MSKYLFIDLGEREVTTYIFVVRKGAFELAESRKYPVSEKNFFPFDEVNDHIEKVYLSLPLGSLNFRVLDLPFSDKERIRQILPLELEGNILTASEGVIFDNIVLGPSNGERHQVLVVFVQKAVIRDILEQLKSRNIDPVGITSLELRHAIKNFSIEKLLSPVTLDDNDRSALASEEIANLTINLRRDEFSYTRDIEETKKSLKFTAVLIVLFVLVLSADLMVKIWSARKEIKLIKGDIRRTYQTIFPEEKNIVNELHQLKSHMKELRGKEDSFLGIDTLSTILALSAVDRQDVILNELIMDKATVTVKGEAPSLTSIQHFKSNIDSLFTSTNISDSRASAQGKMLFTITAKGETSH